MPTNSDVSSAISHSFLFFFVFLVILFSWILIDLWARVVNNFTFITLGLDEKSTYQTFIIALVATLIVVSIIFYLKTLGMDYETQIAGDCINEKDPFTDSCGSFLNPNEISFGSPVDIIGLV